MFTGLQSDKSVLYNYYDKAEEEFVRLIQNNNLDNAIKLNPDLMSDFEKVLNCALIDAYRIDKGFARAHLFLQRILYYINRLKLFWFDDLANYINENSSVLFEIRLTLETEWIAWEESHIETESLNSLIADEALGKRVEEDLEDTANVEQFPTLEGRQLVMMMAPNKK